MAKILKAKADPSQVKLTQKKGQKSLKGKGKSNTLLEVPPNEFSKRRKRTLKVDQEIILCLPFLNLQQKRVILALIKAFVLNQRQAQQKLDKVQRHTLKDGSGFYRRTRLILPGNSNNRVFSPLH